MTKKKDASALRELRKILRRERPKEEIDLIVEQVRQKLFEYNRIRDFDKLLDSYKDLFEQSKEIVEKYKERCIELRGLRFEYQKLQQDINLWRGIAITFITTTLGFVVTLMFYLYDKWK